MVADLSQLPLKDRALIAVYRWRRIEPVPCASLRQPMTACRVALVGTAGLVPPGEPPFDAAVRGGDVSYRVIPADTSLQALELWQRSEAFDRTGIEQDRNLAFPLDRLHELATSGVVGEVAPRHLSFMGSVTAPGRLVKQTAPRAVDLLVEDQVAVALLVPV